MALSTDHQDRVSRLWSKIKKGKPNECWRWQGALSSSGYGKLMWSSKPREWKIAHRFVWELQHGFINDSRLCVCHSCDNRICCNPAHLWLGTRAANNIDKQSKGRDGDKRGSKNGRAKLLESDVKKIRKLLDSGYSQSEIARMFGVIQAQISRIQHGITWKHVE